jgi:hypothetical protein
MYIQYLSSRERYSMRRRSKEERKGRKEEETKQ